MFRHHVRTARFATAYVLLFTAALTLMVPKVSIPKTLYDGATTPTNEIVAQKNGPSSDFLQTDTPVVVPKIFAQSRTISVRRILTAYAGQSTDSRTFHELF
jgi:hypothetical protein